MMLLDTKASNVRFSLASRLRHLTVKPISSLCILLGLCAAATPLLATESENIITKIDKKLNEYYRTQGIYNYYNENNQGKFALFCEEQEFGEDEVVEELELDEDDCGLVDFDDNFPFPKKISSESDYKKEKFIPGLLKKLAKNDFSLVDFNLINLINLLFPKKVSSQNDCEKKEFIVNSLKKGEQKKSPLTKLWEKVIDIYHKRKARDFLIHKLPCFKEDRSKENWEKMLDEVFPKQRRCQQYKGAFILKLPISSDFNGKGIKKQTSERFEEAVIMDINPENESLFFKDQSFNRYHSHYTASFVKCLAEKGFDINKMKVIKSYLREGVPYIFIVYPHGKDKFQLFKLRTTHYYIDRDHFEEDPKLCYKHCEAMKADFDHYYNDPEINITQKIKEEAKRYYALPNRKRPEILEDFSESNQELLDEMKKKYKIPSKILCRGDQTVTKKEYLAYLTLYFEEKSYSRIFESFLVSQEGFKFSCQQRWKKEMASEEKEDFFSDNQAKLFNTNRENLLGILLIKYGANYDIPDFSGWFLEKTCEDWQNRFCPYKETEAFIQQRYSRYFYHKKAYFEKIGNNNVILQGFLRIQNAYIRIPQDIQEIICKYFDNPRDPRDPRDPIYYDMATRINELYEKYLEKGQGIFGHYPYFDIKTKKWLVRDSRLPTWMEKDSIADWFFVHEVDPYRKEIFIPKETQDFKDAPANRLIKHKELCKREGELYPIWVYNSLKEGSTLQPLSPSATKKLLYFEPNNGRGDSVFRKLIKDEEMNIYLKINQLCAFPIDFMDGYKVNRYNHLEAYFAQDRLFSALESEKLIAFFRQKKLNTCEAIYKAIKKNMDGKNTAFFEEMYKSVLKKEKHASFWGLC